MAEEALHDAFLAARRRGVRWRSLWHRGVDEGLRALEDALQQGGLDAYGQADASPAEIYLAAGRKDDAREAYRRALDLCRQEFERRLGRLSD